MTNRTLQKNTFQVASLLLGVTVIFGAFGAHLLKGLVDEKGVEIFNKGVQYQFIHSFALLILALNMRRLKEKNFRTVIKLFLIGIALFCGSLYLLSLQSILGLADIMRMVALLTPIGGACFIGGWFYLAITGYSSAEGESSSRTSVKRKKVTEESEAA